MCRGRCTELSLQTLLPRGGQHKHLSPSSPRHRLIQGWLSRGCSQLGSVCCRGEQRSDSTDLGQPWMMGSTHPEQSFTEQTLGFMMAAGAVSAHHFCHLPFSFLTLGRAVKCLLLVMSALNPFSRALMDPEENRDVSLASERRTKRK